MSRNKIIYYNENLKVRARELRSNQTDGEKCLWRSLRRKQVLGCEFHRQVPLDHFIVDFYCHELKVAIEIDGSSHNGKAEYDTERQGILEEHGVTFLRYSEEEACVAPDKIISQIATWIKEHRNEI